MTSHRSHTVLLAGIGIATALGLTACGSSGGGSLVPNASSSNSAHPTTSANASAKSTTATGGTGSTSTGTGGTTSGTAGGGTTAGGGGSGASINLSVTQTPSCPSGTNVVYYPGRDVIISWTTTGATGVDLNVDGSPGVYGSYGPSGSQELGFPCDSSPNTIRTHTYTITTKGGVRISKSVSASATVNEITTVTTPPSAPVSAPASPPVSPPASP